MQRKGLWFGSSMNSGEASCFDSRNVGLIVEMRADSTKEILRFSSGIFRQISIVFQQDFQLSFSGFSGGWSWQSKMQLCVKCRDLVKISIFRSGVVFTPEVGMKHVDRRWKAYPVGNRGKFTWIWVWSSKVLMTAGTIKWKNLENCMPKGSKDYEG